ncbi:MAG TPA: glutamate-cysteine ligase family protein [Candidatus Kapabacteria bacterium]|nr:glutamate-cysteine ligase family protein [Candidatus Kapabacteria bacterium]
MGLEVEATPIVVRDGRERVAEIAHVLDWIESIGRSRDWDFSRARDRAPLIGVAGGGIITLEPGGQIEYSSAVRDDAETVLDEVEGFFDLLDAHAADAGIELRHIGFNDACPVEEIPLQLDAPRYREMDAYFAAISPYGRAMMRATCALQISLDFGTGAVAAERWRLANMIAPAMNALFANSPHERDGRRYRSYRHEIWRHVDPTRTGRLFDKPDLDPVADYLRFALDARVMMYRVRNGDGDSSSDSSGNSSSGSSSDSNGGSNTGSNSDMRRPEQPLTFRQWIDRSGPGLPAHAPDLADWELHLTTLFPDVRARGFMELRSIDAQPPATRRVAVALVTALVYDEALRHEALARLESRERVRKPNDHERDGYWQSDLATGRELLALARAKRSLR